jgi:hypothetical protein
MIEVLVFTIGILVTYLYIYQHVVHHSKSKAVPSCQALSSSYEGCKVMTLSSPSKFVGLTRAIFNPSVYVTPRESTVIIARYTPGHQLTAGLAYLPPGTEDDLDLDLGFSLPENGLRFLPRAILYRGGLRDPELVYVPVNLFPWQEETSIWKQGEDLRLFKVKGRDNLVALGVLLDNKHSSRLAIGEISTRRETLCWIPRILLNGPGESDKNWTLLKQSSGELYFLTHAFPRWRVVAVHYQTGVLREVMNVDTSRVIRAMDIRISNYGASYTRDVLGALHLGGGEAARFRPGTKLLALHTHRPYRTVFCEVSSETLLPLRLSTPLAVRDNARFIEIVTSVSELDEERIILGVGVEDCAAEIIVHRKSVIDKTLKINVTP